MKDQEKQVREVSILIADDDEGHLELVSEGLLSAGIHNPIIKFRNGRALWEFVQNQVVDSSSEDNAWLLLLDINMPQMDGVEVLRRMKSSPNHRKIPVIMLTTTDDPREVDLCYQYGCNFYITKPVEFAKFADVLKKLGLFMQVVSI